MAATVSIQLDLYPVGTQYGAAVPFAAGKSTVSVVPAMTAADASNPANSAYMAIEASSDGGKTWFPTSTYTWQGGTNALTNGPNYPILTVTFSPTPPPPTHVRAVIGPAQPISMGVSLDFS